jgi:hypothetical protein
VDSAVAVDPHNSKTLGVFITDGQRRNCRVGIGVQMRLHHRLKVHPVELIARQYQHVLNLGLLDISQLLADGVGGSLVPGFSVVGLLSRQDFDEAISEPVEPVGLPHVPMETYRIELSQHIDLVQTGIHTV